MNSHKSLFLWISRTLRIEVLHSSRTLLEPHHCPGEFTVRGMDGLNLYRDGGIVYEIQGRDEVELAEGVPIYLAAGVPMRMRNLNPGKTISVWHSFRFSILDAMDPLRLLEIPIVLSPSRGDVLDRISRELMNARADADENFFRPIAREHELGIRLFQLLLEESTLRPDAMEILIGNERIQPVLRHMQRNYRNRFRVRELADMLAVSEPRFFELFRNAAGMPPGQYLLQIRMRKAQEFLMHSDTRISEVALQVGYEDPFHFSRQFKTFTGLGPERFRAQFKSDAGSST